MALLLPRHVGGRRMFPLPPPLEPDEPTGEPEREPAPQPREARPVELFPRAWRPFLRSNVRHYRLLKKAERRRLRGDAWTFINGKDWEGCAGLAVTDEMRVT